MAMLITTAGQATIASAITSGNPLQLTTIAVGDGNGSAVTPSSSQTALIHQIYSGQITQYTTVDGKENTIIMYFVIPSTSGGYTIREIGVFDSDNTLIAVGSTPDIYKPDPAGEESLNVTLRCTLVITNEVTLEVSSDPDFEVIKTEIVNVTDSIFEVHNTDANAHPNLALPTGGSDGDVLTKVGTTSRVVAWKSSTNSAGTINSDTVGDLYID